MTAVAEPAAAPVVRWDAPEHEWEQARSSGIGASSAATVLGFIRWRSPWQVWAEKTNAHRPDDAPSAAADLGNDLEPWLLTQAEKLIGLPVRRTDHRMYAHSQHPWRLCSPDGWVPADRRLVEVKTAGLASGYGIPYGWDGDACPLGYEIQCRWQMHVMDAPAVELVALVAGLGVVRRTVTRDLEIEADLVAQVDAWWQRFVIGGEEPPFEAADKDTVAFLYPTANGESVDLDRTAAPDLIARRVAAADRRKLADTEVDLIDNQIKALLGNNEVGRIGGRVACAWSERRGSVDWKSLAADLAEANGLTLPDPNPYRRPSTRSLSVKDTF